MLALIKLDVGRDARLASLPFSSIQLQ